MTLTAARLTPLARHGIGSARRLPHVNERSDQALLTALAAVADAFRSLTIPSMIIGGIAVIARGIPRQTIDIDATVLAERVDLPGLLEALARYHVVPRIVDAMDFARRHQILLLKHDPSGIPVDLSLAWLPFEREALERASAVDFGGVRIRVATPEDLIVYKAAAWRDRDRSDIERLLVRYGTQIDLDRIRALVQEFALALDEPGRSEGFEALVVRALGVPPSGPGPDALGK